MRLLWIVRLYDCGCISNATHSADQLKCFDGIPVHLITAQSANSASSYSSTIPQLCCSKSTFFCGLHSGFNKNFPTFQPMMAPPNDANGASRRLISSEIGKRKMRFANRPGRRVTKPNRLTISVHLQFHLSPSPVPYPGYARSVATVVSPF